MPEIWNAFVTEQRPTKRTLMLIRLLDLCIVIPMIFIFAIPMLVAAMAIWLEDRGSVLFIQTRVGQGNHRFKILKFRTMFTDHNRILGDEHVGLPSQEARAQFETTSTNDKRVTKVGKVLRPAHLDELPQLLNVFLGQMSLVGVRPDVPVQEADYMPEVWQERHRLKPGITGLAQVDSTVENTEQRTIQDLKWVQNASVGLYLLIILKTFAKVLKRNSV